MTAPQIRIATGNPAKLALIGGLFEAQGFVAAMAAPGDAESLAPTGYQPAVLAKLAAIADEPGGSPVVAHDSGFEFDCLDGQPGPRTKDWLVEFGRGTGGSLIPGSRVRAVHWMALRCGSRVVTYAEHDDRVVPGRLVMQDSELPLTDAFIGPRDALNRLVARVTTTIREDSGREQPPCD